MKKIIDGKVYNTETAACVGEWSNEYYCNNFKYASEELYKKKNGEFFLYGEGGPISIYAVSTGNSSWSGGSKINPLTPKEAYSWAMEKLSASKFEEIFGTITEDETNHLLSVNLPNNIYQLLLSLANSNEKSISDIITEFVTNTSNSVQAESTQIKNQDI